jgi:hypothetical protein
VKKGKMVCDLGSVLGTEFENKIACFTGFDPGVTLHGSRPVGQGKGVMGVREEARYK